MHHFSDVVCLVKFFNIFVYVILIDFRIQKTQIMIIMCNDLKDNHKEKYKDI